MAYLHWNSTIKILKEHATFLGNIWLFGKIAHLPCSLLDNWVLPFLWWLSISQSDSSAFSLARPYHSSFNSLRLLARGVLALAPCSHIQYFIFPWPHNVFPQGIVDSERGYETIHKVPWKDGKWAFSLKMVACSFYLWLIIWSSQLLLLGNFSNKITNRNVYCLLPYRLKSSLLCSIVHGRP